MTAIFSKCRQYRYRLERPGDPNAARGPAVFIMLNPSTADARLDDPTIRRCHAFAKLWGCNSLLVANLYALRSAEPAALWRHQDPVGPRNDWHLRQLALGAGEIVCAWGATAKPDRVAKVAAIFADAGARLLCLGVTKSGAPRHPLYVRADQPLIEWHSPSPPSAARKDASSRAHSQPRGLGAIILRTGTVNCRL